MKLPEHLNAITLSRDVTYRGGFPPLGFHKFQENALGNGDFYGLYWPIGKEDQEPIVAFTWHDEFTLAPYFSSLERFLKCAGYFSDCYDDNRHVDTPSLEDDPESPLACFYAAREALKQNKPEPAIRYLETAAAVLPEFTEALVLLASQYRRFGRLDEAIVTSIQAVRSPPTFGRSGVQALRWLARLSECPKGVERDPIWQNRTRIKFQFGRDKFNDDYLILREAIDVYIERRELIAAITLAQAYQEWMCSETVSFKERYNFRRDEFAAWQVKLSNEVCGKPRLIDWDSID